MKCYLLIMLFLSSCANSIDSKSKVGVIVHNQTNNVCDSSKYSVVLKTLYTNFEAKNLSLDSSFKLDKKLNIFLDTVDKECLKKQIYFSRFICILLLKQYYFHISKYHQSFDLLSMQNGNAKYIIDRFRILSNQNIERLEMLNSRYVIDYINKEADLKNDRYIKNLIKRIIDTESKIKY